MGITNSFSVEASRSAFGVQMCIVIHVWDSNHSNQTQAICRVIKSLNVKSVME